MTLNPLLTLVTVRCAQCGSTARVVREDREFLGIPDVVCCYLPKAEVSDLPKERPVSTPR
jgi:hypothetical protein